MEYRYFVKFSECKESVNYVKRRLKAQKLNVEQHDFENECCFIISAPAELLSTQAEKLNIIRSPICSEEVTTDEQNIIEDKRISTHSEMWMLHHIIQATTYEESAFAVKRGKGKGFLTYLKTSNPPIVVESYPLHQPKEKDQLKSMLNRCMLPWRQLDLKLIRNYFGEEVAFYFAWMNFYSTFVIIPAIIGLVMFLLRPSDNDVDTDAYLPFYSVFIAIWGVLFLVFWQRQSAVHSYQWNTYEISAIEESNPEFHGTHQKDPVTNEITLQYPDWKHKLWYVFSFLAMQPLLAIGVLVMTLSLNLNGYVKDINSPIYVEFLAEYAKPGGLFAADSPYYGWLIPTIAHSVIISIINKVYSFVAEKCTDLENHRTVHEWQSSLVIKRVSFECFDCFMPLFYIAFYQLDVVTLRAEITSLFMSDEIRRIILESILPLLQEVLLTKKIEKKSRKSLPPDLALADYELFDDYLEMVIQFGYITLFASSFTLGPLVTFLFLYLELRSDLFKLLYAYKRPLPRRVRNIGVWSQVMKVMVLVSILTNCMILGFASEQLMQWLPWMFTTQTNDGDQTMALGSGRYVVGIVFGAEHILILIALLLQWAISPVPEWVRIRIARRNYLEQMRILHIAKRK